MTRLLVLVALSLAGAVVGQTLRPNHRLDEELRRHHNRGRLWQFSPLERPFRADELASALSAVGGPIAAFAERTAVRPGQDHLFTWGQYDQGLLSTKERFHSVLRLGAGTVTSSNVRAFTSFYIDNQLDADSSYIGKRQNGMAAFTEQAFMTVEPGRFAVKFGRDYLVWGPGLDAALLISAAARPADQLYCSWSGRLLKYSYVTAVLDRGESSVGAKPVAVNRYLSGHRLEWHPRKYLRLAISETALFGGPGAGLDFALMNPFIFFTGEEHNGPQTANVMAAFDFAVMPLNLLMIYGSLLVDDLQLEHATVDDQEPAEYGVLVGANWADPLGIAGVDLFAEYSLVTNRTYNGQGGDWEKYLHRNVPIGHFLGNDFDRWIVGARWRPNPYFRGKIDFDHRRRGEGRVARPFDTPWRDLPPGTTYAEPFPTGVVERSDRFRVSMLWQPYWWGSAQLDAAYRSVSQVENQPHRQERLWEVRLLLSVEFYGSAPLP